MALIKIKNINIYEIVLAAILSVTLGIIFSFWTIIYDFFSPILKALGLKYLTAGIWILPAVFPIFIIRKKGIAIFCSLTAALVESTISGWGLMALMWGMAQGGAAEFVFFIFKYKIWNFKIILSATLLSTTASYIIDYLFYNYSLLSIKFNLMQVFGYYLSSIFFATFGTIIISKKLYKTGVLNPFQIYKDNNAQ